MDDHPIDSTARFEEALNDQKKEKYVLRLYVAGNTARSAKAIANLRQICETNLKDRFELEVVDIYQQPELVRDQQVIATPTLIKSLPLPIRRIIGDLAQPERILIGLDIRPVENGPDNIRKE